MIAVFAVFLFLIAAAGCFVGANFCTSPAAQQSLAGLGGALVGMTLPQVPRALQNLFDQRSAPRDSQAGHATPHMMLLGALILPALLFGLVLPSMSCKNVKPDQFFEAVVDCAKINPETSAATAGVTTCLVSAVAGNPAACLAQLVTVAHFTVDEVACIVAWKAEQENRKVGTAELGPGDIQVRNAAVYWLSAEHIRIANSYPGVPR